MITEDVAIFWDYENCAAATQYTGHEVVKKIRHVAHCFGTVKLFKAYLELSDPAVFSKSLVLRSELQSSGVSLTDCPHNGHKDVADKMILVDMLAYAIDNPPPSTIILISGDHDFAYAVSILRLRRYRVVIVSLPGVHTSLKTQASIFLDWNNDVLGADVIDDCWPPRDSPVSLHCPGQSSDKYDTDIMDYLPCKGTNTPHHYELPVSCASRVISKKALSYPKPATPTSYEAEESPPMALLQTRSAPAALLTDEISSTPMVISNPLPSEAEVESIARESSTCASIPETQCSNQKISGVSRNTQPLPIALTHDSMTAANQDNISMLGTASNAVLTPIAQLHPDGGAPEGSTVSTSTAPTQQSQPKVVPSHFTPLVRRLEFHRSKGFLRPFRSGIAVELASKDNMVYRRASTEGFGEYIERFREYVALAEKAGIIELGGKERDAWIALRPEWYDAKIS